MRLRVNEIFQTFSGEGPHTGEMTTFIRFGGCNLRCSGWGVKTTLPNGKEVVGCDTPHAVFPELYKDDPKLLPSQILDQIPAYPRRITITGGEPFMQDSALLGVLCTELLLRGHTIDFFTNGTLSYTPFAHLLKNPRVSLCLDYKLPGSGEHGKYNPDNTQYLDEDDEIKFVVRNREDYEIAKEARATFLAHNRKLKFSIGPVWDEIEPGEIIGWILSDKLDIKLNLQTHQLIGVNESERDWHFD